MKVRGGRTAILVGGLMIGATTITGCVTTGIAASQTAEDDACRAERLALDESQTYFARNIAKSALIGTLAGAVIGGIVSGGSAKGVLIGAGVGAVAGGVSGYWTSLQQQKLAGEGLYSKLNGDMTEALAKVNQTQAAYNRLSRCRAEEAKTIRGLFLSGKLNREQANAQLALLRARARQDYEIAVKINADVKAKTDGYIYATEQATGRKVPRSSTATLAGTPASTEAGSLQCCSVLQASYTNFEANLNATRNDASLMTLE